MGAQLKFSYRRESLNRQGETVIVTLNGATIFTMNDGGAVGTDLNYHNIVIPLSAYNANGINTLQFITNGSTASNDFFWIDNVELTYWKNPPVCYVTKIDDANFNGAYSLSSLNIQTASFTLLGICEKDNDLGVLAHLVASEDNRNTGVDVPVIIEVLENDIIGKPQANTVTTSGGLLQPSNGTSLANANGTVTYIPNPGYIGTDTFEYSVCSAEDPSVCDIALVTVNITCASTPYKNEVNGSVFLDVNGNGVFNNGESGFPNVSVNLYQDNNKNGVIDVAEPLIDTQNTQSNGLYQFVITPQSTTSNYLDQFNSNSTANQSNGSSNWTTSWAKIGDVGDFSQNNVTITSANGLRIRSNTNLVSGAYRSANLSNAISASLSINYTEQGLDLDVNDYVDIQVASSSSPSSWNLLKRLTGADGIQTGTETFDISAYMSSVTTVRMVTSGSSGMNSGDIIYFDNVSISYQSPIATNYLVRLAQPIPLGYSLTTPLPSPTGTHAAAFTGSGGGSCANNFGLGVADLAIIKTVNNTTPYVGDTVTFSITAINNGPGVATGVEVQDIIPAGYTLTGVTLSTGTLIAPTWFIGNLANAQTETMTLVAKVNASGSYVNTAIISGSQPDPDTTNNDSTAITNPIPVADLSIDKSVNNPTPHAGDTITFKLVAKNLGPSNGTGVVVLDSLPSGYVLVNSSSTKGTYSYPNWSIGTLVFGDSATLSLEVQVQESGVYLNTGIISGNEIDPNSGNNTSSSTPTIIRPSSIAYYK